MPFAVPFCGYGTVDFGIIPDRMKEDGNQIVVYQPEGELEKESNLHLLVMQLTQPIQHLVRLRR